MNLNKQLLDRLICSKYIFHKGVDILERGGPFSSGLGVLHFQDAAEMVLRIIAEHLHCSLKENAAFNQIIDSIDSLGAHKITHRSALNQLNKARINFKHFGLEPKHEDVIKFRRDLEGFFPNVFKLFLDVDFHLISLANLIEHRRTENFLNKAEKLIQDRNYRDSICSSAIAFAIFNSHYNKEPENYGRDPFRRIKDTDLQRWVEGIEELVLDQQAQLNLIMNGINLANYRRFQRCVPVVQLSVAGTYSVFYLWDRGQMEPSLENALFCYNFVIDAILLMKANKLPSRYPGQKPVRKFEVIKEGPIIVWPGDDQEIIRSTEIGEILYARHERSDRADHIAIILDGDDAFVESACVTVVN